MNLAQGYSLQETLNGAQMLKRPGGYVLTTFGIGVRPKNIQRIVEADENREEYLQALEAAYRE